jgi:cell division protein ZipA
VSAADSPERFSSLKVAWRLWNSLDDAPEDLSPDDLEDYRLATEKMLASLGKFTTKIERSGDDALKYVANLPDLVAACDKDVAMILVAPNGRPFSGQDVWDVMLCLGLEYGDGDLFHWNNNSAVGDDQFFTVETSTSPGYFIPQRIASGGGDVDDLIFYFSIPCSADPVAVFDSMANAVEYAQRRLGGKTVLRSGEPFGKEAERAKIERIVQRLKEAGFVPGESSTLRVF